jgi:broad specificity phosphatase PhoE
MGAIYLLRHGQASFGSDDYDKLSAIGHAQAKVLGTALKARGVQPTLVASGTMQRHLDTAAGSLQAMGLAHVPDQHAGVNEYDHEDVIRVAEPRYVDKMLMMGELAAGGDPRRAFQQFFRGAVMRWVEGEQQGYVETWAAFKQRSLAALDELVRRTGAKDTTLVYTSGGFISVVVAHLLGLDDRQAFTINWTLANTGITKLVSGRDGLHLISVNEHAHLEGGEPGLLTYR